MLHRYLIAMTVNSDDLVSCVVRPKLSCVVREGVSPMSDFENLSLRQVLDCGNKIGGEERAKRFMSGELVLVERQAEISVSGQANGGVTYATGINEAAFRADWQKYLNEVFGINADFLSAIKLPPFRAGFGWGVVMPQGLSDQRMLNVLKPRFADKLWQWCQNLDEVLDPAKEARTTANGPYVVWCRDRVEADEELKNLSANNLTKRGINCMTEPERIMLEGWFHWKTGSHLDTQNVTLSVGSRDSDGNVPSANWYADSGFNVHGYFPDYCGDYIRAREVVSL